MEKEVLGCVLKRCWKDYSISQVIGVDSSPAVGKNENFLSTVSRLTLKVVLGNGRTATRSLIVKDANVATKFAEVYQLHLGAFITEIMMYTTVLKEMEYLMEECEETEDILWSRLVHHIPYNCLVFDDLKAQGFKTMGRTEFYDMDHSLMAVNALGRLHGMSKVLEERGIICKDAYKPWYVTAHFDLHKLWAWNMAAAVKGMKMHWDPKWGPLLDKIKVTPEDMHERMSKFKVVDETKFNVLNHGDCHQFNIMFKYDWQNRPIDIKFVDFQIPHYGSPCCDLTYLLYLTTEPSLRRKNMDLLLSTYHQSLIRTFERHGFIGKFPTLQEIKDDMEKYFFIGLWLFIFAYPSRTTEHIDKYFDQDKLDSTQGEEGYNLDLYKRESIEKAVGPDFEIFIKNFF